MLNMNQFLGNNEVKDNTVIINGASFKVNDDVALKIMNLVCGIEAVSTPVEKKTPVESKSTEKKPYVATKDFKAQYEVKKQVSSDGKELFCISRKNGWTKAEKACMNNAIKALDKIITIDVSYDKDGKTRTFKAWGYKTKKQAESMMATLPAVFTADQLNKAL